MKIFIYLAVILFNLFAAFVSIGDGNLNAINGIEIMLMGVVTIIAMVGLSIEDLRTDVLKKLETED